MESEQPGQSVPPNQQGESATDPPAPATPAHEEADKAAPQPDEEVAPDSDDPGDQTIPEELQDHVHDGDIPQDNVDQVG